MLFPKQHPTAIQLSQVYIMLVTDTNRLQALAVPAIVGGLAVWKRI